MAPTPIVLGFLAKNGGIGSLGNIPIRDILVILIGMPLFAALIGWVLGGRWAMARQPMD
jgi:hypothetical protein